MDYKEGEHLNQLMEAVKHQKYDKSLEDRLDMYDRIEYKKDPDLINQGQIKLISGNVMKFYTFHYNPSQPFVIQTRDEQMKEKLAQMQHELDLKIAHKHDAAQVTVDTEEEN